MLIVFIAKKKEHRELDLQRRCGTITGMEYSFIWPISILQPQKGSLEKHVLHVLCRDHNLRRPFLEGIKEW